MIHGYKAFKKDKKGLYTDGMGNSERVYWKKGDRKTINGDPKLCKNGFHFFEYLCFALNYLEPDNVVCKVVVHGDVAKDTFKLCTNDIEIGRKVTKREIKKLLKDGRYNSGHHNSGHYNSGHYNSGNYNSGNYNSGNFNSGNYNSGHHNSGNFNSGNYNSGHHNSGHHNSGYYNSGNYNSGHHNSGRYNSGRYNSSNGYKNYFCTTSKTFLFDVEINQLPDKLDNIPMEWFDATNGYKNAWKKCPQSVLDTLRSIPEFQKPENIAKFKEITGIDL